MIKAQSEGFLSTPALWEGTRFGIVQFEFSDLAFPSFIPQAIPQNIRLGHQVEYIFKQLLDHSDSYDLILHNLQIKDEKRTLGEIDFIIRDQAKNKLIHVELTYKFYLIDTEITEPINQLIGPNRRDTFMLKKEKIKNVQFPLLHSVEGIQALCDININHHDLEHQCCFKAQLYKPYLSKDIDLGYVNSDCIVGSWLRLDDLEGVEFSKADYYMPSKSEWIVDPHAQVSWQSLSGIKPLIIELLDKAYAPMIWVKKSKTEFYKYFVVWW